LRIAGSYRTPLPGSTQFALTPPSGKFADTGWEFVLSFAKRLDHSDRLCLRSDDELGNDGEICAILYASFDLLDDRIDLLGCCQRQITLLV
jgi:hypothetical protein